MLSRWPVDVVAAVPVLGRSWAAERAVARSATEVVGAAQVLAERLPSVRAGAGGIELVALAALRADLEEPVRRSAAAYDALDQQPLGLTPPQVSDGVRQARDALGPAVAALQQADAGLSVVSGLLGADGPRSVLVMLQNNAELRGTGGYTSSFATGRTQDGRLVLEPLQDLIEVADPPERDRYLPAPEEYVEDFQMFGGNSTMWRTWNMSPHVPDSALVGARIAGAVLGEEPDVLVLLDVPAMGALAALGGAEIRLPDGSSVQPAELTESLLVDSYAAAGRTSRRRSAAGCSCRKPPAWRSAACSTGTCRLPTSLGRWRALPTSATCRCGRLAPTSSGRSRRSASQARWGLRRAATSRTSASTTSEPTSSTSTSTGRSASPPRSGPTSATVTQRVRFTNSAPEGLVPYVAGVQRPGVVVSRAELSLPESADGVTATIDGRPWDGAVHTGGGRTRLIARLELPRGVSSVLEARYTVPLVDGRYRLRLVPQPLVEDARLTLDVHGADGQPLDVVSGADEGVEQVEERGTLGATRDVVVQVARPTRSRWDRLRQWWDSPVQVG